MEPKSPRRTNGGGFGNHLVDEGRSSTEIPAKSQPAGRIAADPLATMLPGRPEAEMALRRRIHLAQHVSGVRMHTLRTDHGRWLNQILAEKALVWTYSAASTAILNARVDFLLKLAFLTSEAEILGGPDD